MHKVIGNSYRRFFFLQLLKTTLAVCKYDPTLANNLLTIKKRFSRYSNIFDIEIELFQKRPSIRGGSSMEYEITLSSACLSLTCRIRRTKSLAKQNKPIQNI